MKDIMKELIWDLIELIIIFTLCYFWLDFTPFQIIIVVGIKVICNKLNAINKQLKPKNNKTANTGTYFEKNFHTTLQ